MALYIIERVDIRADKPQPLTSRTGSPYLFREAEIDQKVESLNTLRGSTFVSYQKREYK